MPRRKASEAAAQEIEIPDIKRARPEISVRCGDCLFLRRYQTYGAPCEQLGSTSGSVTCARFVTDPDRLGDPRAVMDSLRLLVRSRNAPALAASAQHQRRVQRMGWSLGDVAYFRVYGGDYLCNYAYGVVTGCSRAERGSPDRLVIMGAHGFVALLRPDALMTRDDFLGRRQLLLARNRIDDPQGGLRKLSVRGRDRLVHYEPPQAGMGKRKSKGPRSSFSGKRKKKTDPILLSSG